MIDRCHRKTLSTKGAMTTGGKKSTKDTVVYTVFIQCIAGFMRR